MKKEDCLFELNYLKLEETVSGDKSIASKRIELGRSLARTLPVEGDIVVPVPETSILFAQGYALEAKLPLAHAILKKRPKKKTLFIDERKETIKDIFIIIPELIKGRKIIFIDETVISGLSLTTVIAKVRKAEPKEIHVRLIAPPMIRRCPSSSFADSWSFVKGDYKKHFGVDSFEFLSFKVLDSYAKCYYCFGGEKDESKMVGPQA